MILTLVVGIAIGLYSTEDGQISAAQAISKGPSNESSPVTDVVGLQVPVIYVRTTHFNFITGD